MAGAETNAPPDEQRVIEEAIADGIRADGDSRTVPFDVGPGTPTHHVVHAEVRRLTKPEIDRATFGQDTFWYDDAAYRVEWSRSVDPAAEG